PHVPPPGRIGPVSLCGEPPLMSTRLRPVSAKNPMDRPSGDQNGRTALSVPARGCAVTESSGRSQSREGPALEATNTILRASVESEKDIRSVVHDVVDGVVISTRIS